ncbi:MAG: DedA family protein [Candidatus Taylorbacteria bacterium]
MPDWLIQNILHYKYLLIFVVAIFEGPILMAFCGAMIKLGYLALWPAFVALMVGDLIADTGWYYAGYHGGMRFVDRFGKYIGINREKIKMVSHFFHKYHNSILFFSKVTSGFGFAIITLVTAGLVKIPFRKYLFLNGLGQFVWTGLLIALGYLFEHLYVTIEDTLGRATLIVFSVVVLASLVRAGFIIHKKIQEGKIQ